MPLLFSIGIQGALEEVADAMRPDEQICAFLDDVYIVCQPERVRVLFDLLAESLFRVAGIRIHDGKTRVWNASGTVPDNVEELGPAVWQPRGITVLGTPIGSPEYTAERVERRLAEERLLWEAIPAVPDLQCAWQILVQCPNPRGNHTIRTLPPGMAVEYARVHDEGIWNTAIRVLADIPGSEAERERARELASLPLRMGGLGLRSMSRCSRAAYWASWADALPMIQERNPAIAEIVEKCDGPQRVPSRGVSLRVGSGHIPVGSGGVRRTTKLVRIAQGQATAHEPIEGTRRVAARLAVLGIFRLRSYL